MSQELVYTSAPKGLRISSSGFCTVACTRGMAPNYVEHLEALSGYTAVFPPHDPKAPLNPVSWSHCSSRIGGKSVNILSRIAFAGVDHTQRSNKFAYHLVLDDAAEREGARGGPAWVMQQDGLMRLEWHGEPAYLDRRPKIPAGAPSSGVCAAWKRVIGDAGWAGVLAQAFLDDPRHACFILFEPGTDTLSLVAEALRLLPPELRWDITFNTYFMSLPIGTTCLWRCCLRDSPALRVARQMPGTLVLDLMAGKDQPEEARRRMQKGSALIECARSGAQPPPFVQAETEPETMQSNLDAKSRQARTPTAPIRVSQMEIARQAPPVHGQRPPPPPKAPSQQRKLIVAGVACFLLLSLGVNIYFFVARRPPPPPALGTTDSTVLQPSQPATPHPSPSAATQELARKAQELQKREEDAKRAQATAEKEAQNKREREAAEAVGKKEHKEKVEAERRNSEQAEYDNMPETQRWVRPVTDGSDSFAKWLYWCFNPQTPSLDPIVQVLLPVEGIDEKWRIQDIGDWQGGRPEKYEGLEGEKGRQFTMLHVATGEEMTVLTVRPMKGGLLFTNVAPSVRVEDFTPLLKGMAWVKVGVQELQRKEAAYIVVEGLSATVDLKRVENEPERLVGKVALPKMFLQMLGEGNTFPCRQEVKDSEGYDAVAICSVDEQGNDLTMEFKYKYKASLDIQEAEDVLAEWNRRLNKCREEQSKADEEKKEAQQRYDELMAPIWLAEEKRTSKSDELTKLNEDLVFYDNKEDLDKDEKKKQRDLRKQKKEVVKRLDELRRYKENLGSRNTAACNKARKGFHDAEGALQKKDKDVAVLKNDAKEAESNLEVKKKKEREKREEGFGDFRLPLELEVNGNPIATFKLCAPQNN